MIILSKGPYHRDNSISLSFILHSILQLILEPIFFQDQKAFFELQKEDQDSFMKH